MRAICIALCLATTLSHAGMYYTWDGTNVTRHRGDTPYPPGAITSYRGIPPTEPVDGLMVVDGVVVRRPVEDAQERIGAAAASATLESLAPVLPAHPATVPDGGMYYRLADEAGNLALWYVRDSDHVATQLSAHDSEGRAVIRTRYASGAVETVPVGALLSAARIVTAQLLEDMTPAEIGEMLSIHPDWKAGEAVTAGMLRVFGGKLYKAVQAHTTQADWTPPATPALWVAVVPENVIAPWVQPYGGSGTYVSGAQVTHNGGIWRNDVPAPTLNVWEPGVYGWTRIGDA